MTYDYYTENLADFGFREIKMLSEILNAWVSNGLPDNFDTDGVRAAFNKNSGYVFLTNNEYQAAMMNGESLECFYNTPYHGHEGFLSDLLETDPDDYHHEDCEYICDIIQNQNIEPPQVWKNHLELK